MTEQPKPLASTPYQRVRTPLILVLIASNFIAIPCSIVLAFAWALSEPISSAWYHPVYYILYASVFGYPLLCVVFYKLGKYYARRHVSLSLAITITLIPLIYPVSAFVFSAFILVYQKLFLHNQFATLYKPKRSDYVCQKTPLIYISQNYFRGKRVYTVTRLTYSTVLTHYYKSYAALRQQSSIDLSRCKNASGKRIAR